MSDTTDASALPAALLPCPFCGTAAVNIAGALGCLECGIGNCSADRWNRRSDAALDAERARAEAAENREKAAMGIVQQYLVAREAAERERDAAVADDAYSSRLLVKLRDRLINIKDEIEDEGDRAYFGSTNDADDFKAVVNDLDAVKWDRIMRGAKKPDLYATLRERQKALETATARATAAEADAARLRERVRELEEALDAVMEFSRSTSLSSIRRGAQWITCDEAFSMAEAALAGRGA